jgi:polyphosphate kinase 2
MTNSTKKPTLVPGDGRQEIDPTSPADNDEPGNGMRADQESVAAVDSESELETTPAAGGSAIADEKHNHRAQAVAHATAAHIAVQSKDASRVPAKGSASAADGRKTPGDASGGTKNKDKVSIKHADLKLTEEDLEMVNSNRGLKELLRTRQIKVKDVLDILHYEDELVDLQVELVKLQRWILDAGKRVVILFEGRDAAGKGGTIRRFTEHLNPRSLRVVALPKPSDEEKGQWYFQRYSKQLPNKGEIVFFDRSWYNRAVVEPVMGFSTPTEYHRFMQQVPEYEHMLYEDGITIIKFWFSISKAEQLQRFASREHNPLKQWKLSPIDKRAQQMWDKYTEYKEQMFSRTHTSFAPWIIVRANNKRRARLESMRYVLSLFDYTDKDKTKVSLFPDPNIVERFNRNIIKID